MILVELAEALRFRGIGETSLRKGEFVAFELLPGAVNTLLQYVG